MLEIMLILLYCIGVETGGGGGCRGQGAHFSTRQPTVPLRHSDLEASHYLTVQQILTIFTQLVNALE